MSVTAFVTGGTGFLGRRLVSTLLDENIRVRCLVRPSSDPSVCTRHLTPEQKDRVQFVRGDLADEGALRKGLSGADIVYHLAAALGGSCSTMFLNTVIPTRQLVKAAAREGVGRFVLVSSLGVYGTETLSSWGTLDETTPVDPHPERRDPYTFSKIRQEWVARQAQETLGLPLVVVRPGVIYGPGRSPLTSRVGLSVGPWLIRMGGGQLLPYTYVDNCASAIKLAGFAGHVAGEAFNVVDDDPPTGKRILRMLRRQGTGVRSLWIPRGAIGPLSALYESYSRWSCEQLPPVITRYRSQAIWKPLRYSNDKAKQRLHWQPNVTTEEGLQRTIAG